MAENGPPSSQTLQSGSSPPVTVANLDLSDQPPIFVSATHLETDELHRLEEELINAGANLTYDIHEAKMVLSKVTKKARIQFDLRAKGLWTEEVTTTKHSNSQQDVPTATSPPLKKRKVEKDGNGHVDAHQPAVIVEDESTASEHEDDAPEKLAEGSSHKKANTSVIRTLSPVVLKDEHLIRVVKWNWFEKSQNAGQPLPFDDFISYQGRCIEKPNDNTSLQKSPQLRKAKPVTASTVSKASKMPLHDSHILERAKEDASHPPRSNFRYGYGKRTLGSTSGPSTSEASWSAGHGIDQKYSQLLHESTTEHEEGYSSDLPDPPEWVKRNVKYACQRSTPADPPNETFISLLKKIKLARLLTNDEIGVRAYSTSIASLAAYPFKIHNPREILRLPGCDAKIANLYVEYANSGQIKAVEDIEADEDLKVLRMFYDIWGVGATTAREFYYDRGWRDLDDIVEYGWKTLSRVQQIGVKYYEEFLDPIPRAEVEEIGRIIHRHAVKVRDNHVQSLIVGGYRRGKETSGDVDLIVSHPDESQTLNIVNDIVASLEDEGWITHTLLLSLHSTNRDQQTLPFRSAHSGGHGFDTLDKALVVWQDPHWPTKDADLAANPKAKNPNIHRRVDIIISAWRTVGCAVTGWSGGTTFQRDLRRYAKNLKGWKFDSSGVRDRSNGEVVDLEGWNGGYGHNSRAKTMEEAERRVFEGMGLVYREPWERCTG